MWSGLGSVCAVLLALKDGREERPGQVPRVERKKLDQGGKPLLHLVTMSLLADHLKTRGRTMSHQAHLLSACYMDPEGLWLSFLSFFTLLNSITHCTHTCPETLLPVEKQNFPLAWTMPPFLPPFLLLFLLLFWFSLHSPGYFGAHYVDQVGFKFRDPSASAVPKIKHRISEMLGNHHSTH